LPLKKLLISKKKIELNKRWAQHIYTLKKVKV
jgi:hypothetical protein